MFHSEGDAAGMVLFYQTRGCMLASLSAERRLMLAVLADALNQAYGLGYGTRINALKLVRRKGRIASQARAWLMRVGGRTAVVTGVLGLKRYDETHSYPSLAGGSARTSVFTRSCVPAKTRFDYLKRGDAGIAPRSSQGSAGT